MKQVIKITNLIKYLPKKTPAKSITTRAKLIRHFTISKKLAALIDDNSYDSKEEIINKVWQYIESRKLDGYVPMRYVKCDEKLKQLINKDAICANDLESLLINHIKPKKSL